MDLATHIESTVEGFPVSRNLGTNISRDRKINIEKKKFIILHSSFQLFEYFKIPYLNFSIFLWKYYYNTKTQIIIIVNK